MATVRKDTSVVEEKPVILQSAKDAAKAMIEKMREEDSRMVKGIFKNIECPGGFLKFTFKKYKGDQVRTYEMQDGKEYEVPLAVAKHLNDNCAFPVHKMALHPDTNQPYEIIGQMKSRFAFIRKDF